MAHSDDDTVSENYSDYEFVEDGIVVCALCDDGGQVVLCHGLCMRAFHATVEDGESSNCASLGLIDALLQKTFYCKNCQYNQHQCFAYGELGSSDKSSHPEVFCCANLDCGYFYHPHCVAHLFHPENSIAAEDLRRRIAAGEQFECSAHRCHVCKEVEVRSARESQFAVCHRCPRAFHRRCLPREITFEVDVDMERGIYQRAWEGLIPDCLLIYCFRWISAGGRVPKGKWRFISLTPVFCIFTILPLHTTSAFSTAVTAFFFTWLSNFKLLLHSFDSGPIKTQASLPIFIAMAALPFKIRPGPTHSRPKKVLPLSLPTQIPISAILISILHHHKRHIHPYTLLLIYCSLVFLLVEILVGLSSLLLRAFLGLDLEPASDEPYLSTSLQDFWGRRWNLTVSNTLRETVYVPVRTAAAAALGRDAAALVGVVAAFLVSGLMHELLFWYVTRARPSWEMTMFFVVQGVGVVVEFGMKAAMAEKKWRVPGFVRGALTIGFVVGTSFWLFFPPLMRNGADERVIEEIGYGMEVVKEKLNQACFTLTTIYH